MEKVWGKKKKIYNIKNKRFYNYNLEDPRYLFYVS